MDFGPTFDTYRTATPGFRRHPGKTNRIEPFNARCTESPFPSVAPLGLHVLEEMLPVALRHIGVSVLVPKGQELLEHVGIVLFRRLHELLHLLPGPPDIFPTVFLCRKRVVTVFVVENQVLVGLFVIAFDTPIAPSAVAL